MTTKLEYLTARYHEVSRLRDQAANKIAHLVGYGPWRRHVLPGSAVERWMEHCNTLAALRRDIERERYSPPTTMVLQ